MFSKNDILLKETFHEIVLAFMMFPFEVYSVSLTVLEDKVLVFCFLALKQFSLLKIAL